MSRIGDVEWLIPKEAQPRDWYDNVWRLPQWDEAVQRL